MEKKDIFDKIMSLPGLRLFEPFCKKNKEVLLYLFFGGLTILISILSYAYFNVVLGINELLANIIAWILAVTLAFVTNIRYGCFHPVTAAFWNLSGRRWRFLEEGQRHLRWKKRCSLCSLRYFGLTVCW